MDTTPTQPKKTTREWAHFFRLVFGNLEKQGLLSMASAAKVAEIVYPLVPWLAGRIAATVGGASREQLVFACRVGSTPVARWIADDRWLAPPHANTHGWPALRAACESGNPELAEWVWGRFALSRGEMPHTYNLLIPACQAGHVTIAEWLSRRFCLPFGAFRSEVAEARTIFAACCVSGSVAMFEWAVKALPVIGIDVARALHHRRHGEAPFVAACGSANTTIAFLDHINSKYIVPNRAPKNFYGVGLCGYKTSYTMIAAAIYTACHANRVDIAEWLVTLVHPHPVLFPLFNRALPIAESLCEKGCNDALRWLRGRFCSSFFDCAHNFSAALGDALRGWDVQKRDGAINTALRELAEMAAARGLASRSEPWMRQATDVAVAYFLREGKLPSGWTENSAIYGKVGKIVLERLFNSRPPAHDHYLFASFVAANRRIVETCAREMVGSATTPEDLAQLWILACDCGAETARAVASLVVVPRSTSSASVCDLFASFCRTIRVDQAAEVAWFASTFALTACEIETAMRALARKVALQENVWKMLESILRFSRSRILAPPWVGGV